MIKFFGFPILLAFLLGYYFPYIALNLSTYAFIVLFLMMTSSALDIKWTILKKIPVYKNELTFGIFFLFMFFPLIQWFLAKILISEESLFYGTLLASLCPIAIVAPFFTKMHKADDELSFLLMIFSMLLFPIFVYIALIVTPQSMLLRPIIFDMLILIIFPLLFGEIIKWIDHKFIEDKIIANWRKFSAEFNMLAISFLAFVYFGASLSKLNISYTPWREMGAVFLVILFQDFGVYFLARKLTRQFFTKERSEGLTISISMKNFAVSGAILLFYDPKASLASALGFFVHALFYNYLIIKKPKN
jgi:ACR3 family arsenite efflux pump ArsB